MEPYRSTAFKSRKLGAAVGNLPSVNGADERESGQRAITPSHWTPDSGLRKTNEGKEGRFRRTSCHDS